MSKKILICLLGVVLLGVSCTKEDPIPFEPYEPELDLSDPTDKAIYELQQEFGTKIIYRYDRRYVSTSAFAVPPKRELVLPYIENVVRKLFISPYDRQKTDFMREEMPIEMIMFGTSIDYVEGGELNFSATGLATGLSRIIISGINAYNLNSRSWVSKQHATLHHEFAHVLDKKYGRPVGFDNVSRGLYAGGTAYSSFTQAEARSRGFWRNYGMLNETEDFGTWVDGIVTTPKAQVLEIVSQNNLLTQKYNMVYNFYKEKGIDLHELQVYLQNILDNLEED